MSIVSIVKSSFQSAKDEVKSLTANDVLKLVGLQLLRSPGLVRLPLLAVFGGGLVLGAGSALLLAPKSGEDTRKAIGAWFKGALSSLKRGAVAVSDKVEQTADTADAVAHGVMSAKKKVDKAVARELQA